MTVAKARVTSVMIDCHDPEKLMTFWSEITGIEVTQRYPGYVFGSKVPGNHIRISFQQVDEDKVVKNRLHLDLAHEDPDALVARVLELGGSRVENHETSGFHWTVLADPEGNEFCVTPLH